MSTTTEILKRKYLEAELFSLDGQVRAFDRIRDRLAADGKDPLAFYRQLQARREKLVAALKQPGSTPLASSVVHTQPPLARIEEELIALPIAPAKFDHVGGVFGFGTSGFVQVAPASEGIQDFVAAGPHPHSGQIVTVPGSYPGEVTFGGALHVGPAQVPPDEYDATINYWWIHNWNYLIPFPPPTVESLFTYRFKVLAVFSVIFSGGEANVQCFFSLGETSNLTAGTTVTVGPDGGGFPLIADLQQPGPGYNGHYDSVRGEATVQRSFRVAANRVPGVAVVVGAIGALSMMAEVSLTFAGVGYSRINIGSGNRSGRVEYWYEPQMEVSPG